MAGPTDRMLTALQYQLLRRIRTAPPVMAVARAYDGRSKLDVLVGTLMGDVQGKTVIDFGCGDGLEALDLVRRGAARVIGVDLNLGCLEIARWYAAHEGITEGVEFAFTTTEQADVVISIDAFEHFAD